MMLHAQALALTVFAVVMAAAAFEDFRRLVIPNLVPVLLCAFWPVYFAAAPSLYSALTAIGCAAAVFSAGVVLFAFGQLGGGDVKLLGAVALWAGPAGTPALLLLTAVIGGALALFLLMPGAAQIVAAARALLTVPLRRARPEDEDAIWPRHHQRRPHRRCLSSLGLNKPCASVPWFCCSSPSC